MQTELIQSLQRYGGGGKFSTLTKHHPQIVFLCVIYNNVWPLFLPEKNVADGKVCSLLLCLSHVYFEEAVHMH